MDLNMTVLAEKFPAESNNCRTRLLTLWIFIIADLETMEMI